MNKLKTIALLLALLGNAAALFPCAITMESNPVIVKGRNKFAVRLFVETFHRRCPQDIDNTGLAAENLVIEKQGPWQKIEAGLYRLDLTVALKGRGEGRLRLRRECPKRGLQEEILKFESTAQPNK